MRFEIPVAQFGSGSAMVHVDLWADHRGMSWEIRFVEEKPADKRRKSLVHSVDDQRHDSALRKVPVDQRAAYRANIFRKLLGEEVYKNVLRQAWMMAMPEELKESTPTEKEE